MPSANGLARISSAARDILSLVGAWAEPARHLELEINLEAIFTDAIRFSQDLRRQRALWYVNFPGPQIRHDARPPAPLMFDPAKMTDTTVDEWPEGIRTDPRFLRQQYVEMVVAPALYKRGNVDGERYEIEDLVVPASVLMRPPPVQK